jgi:hypothetical protein
LAVLVSPGISLHAQGSGASPYSAYGFGDLLCTGQVSQAIMGGTGIAYTEPYSVVLGNPASYAGLARPVFEVGTSFRNSVLTYADGKAKSRDANFEGFTVGVPFAHGRWGLALGLTPFSDVDYSASTSATIDEGTVQYQYLGSGGLNKVFLGVGHTLWAQRPDSLGNAGSRLLLGLDGNYIFGSLEQTRNAIYPPGVSFSNVRAFSSLVLHGLSSDASLIWQGDLTRRHVKDQENWRYNIGLTAQLPMDLNATYSKLVSTYLTNSISEAVLDTVEDNNGVHGEVDLPIGLGFGASIQNSRWLLTAEVRTRDWSATSLAVGDYSFGAPLRKSMTYAAGARFKPAIEGTLVERMVYRAGIRHITAPAELMGRVVSADAVTVGVSVPLNPVHTNSFLNVGGEFGRRGTGSDELLKEQYATLWIGITFTPWKGERWFTAPKIQ